MFLSQGKYRQLILLLISVIGAQLTFAISQPVDKDGINETNHFSPLVFTISAGPVWATAGATQTFYLQPEIEKTYFANKSTTVLADGELFIGIQRPLTDRFYGQLGLAAATTSEAKLSGNIWDDASPVFNNYTYGYQIRHTHVAAKGKLLTDIRYYSLTPYISGSLGVGFNRARSFSQSPIIFEAVPGPNFSNNTVSAFTYTVGIGLQHVINNHLYGGIGYEFADWGKSQLSRATGQTMGTGLSLSHLYTNGIQLSLSYIA